MPLDDESEAIQRAQSGDRGAMEELVERHEDSIYRFAMRQCGHRDEAQGVTQDTLMAMLRSLDSFEGRSSLSSWLYAVARNACRKRHRRASPIALDEVPEPAASEQDLPADKLERQQLSVELERAVRALDDGYRDVLVLRDIEGLSGAEVAEILGISLAATKSRLHRARAALRDALAPLLHYDELPDTGEALCRQIATTFSQKLEGELSPSMCDSMNEHLSTCPHCQASCDSLRETLALCASAPDHPVPEATRQAIASALEGLLQRPSG